MDLSQSIVPRSDQLNSDDLLASPVTVTITEVKAGNPEQPVEIHTAEFPGRPYKPSKSMRRVLVSGWGSDGSAYAGRRLTLFRNPEITFGRDKVGGIEIASMSAIDKPLTVSLMVTRGKRKPFTVQPLAEPVVRDFLAEASQADGDVGLLRSLYTAAQAAGAPVEVLEGIRALATPAPDEAPAA